MVSSPAPDLCLPVTGGGRRCTYPNCGKGARDKRYCALHGKCAYTLFCHLFVVVSASLRLPRPPQAAESAAPSLRARRARFVSSSSLFLSPIFVHSSPTSTSCTHLRLAARLCAQAMAGERYCGEPFFFLNVVLIITHVVSSSCFLSGATFRIAPDLRNRLRFAACGTAAVAYASRKTALRSHGE